MKAVISHDGSIGNFGDIQPDGLGLPDFTILDPGIAPVPVQVIATAVIPPEPPTTITSTSFAATNRPSFTVASSAGIVPGVSRMATSSAQITFPGIFNTIAFAPLVITPTFGSTITGLLGTGGNPTTAQVEDAINTAINYFDSNWTSSVPIGTSVNGTVISTVSVSIQFDYGAVDPTDSNPGNRITLTSASGAARSEYGLTTLGDPSFAALSSALTGVMPNLPASDPTGGGIFLETLAQSQMLGFTGPGIGPAGFVGLNTTGNGVALDYNYVEGSTTATTGAIGAVGAIEHELSEIFGRVADLQAVSANTYSIMDLYRFSGAHTPAITAGANDYFSINDGVTALAYFNDPNLQNNGSAQLGDTGDWASSGPHNMLTDSFDAFLTTGSAGTISAADAMVLANIGFQAACYMEGTRILTTRGEKRVEMLSIGDELPTLLGGPGRVIWLGRRAMDLTRHPKPWLAWPVRVRAGAFASGQPSRDLFLSPDHAVHVGGVLIPVKLLINDTSVQQVKVDHVVYHHVELEEHDVILAEGLPAESYLDAGDRETFSGGPVTALYPEFTARRWEMAGCALLVLTGAILESVRLILAERAVAADEGDNFRMAVAS